MLRRKLLRRQWRFHPCLANRWQEPASPASRVPGTPKVPDPKDEMLRQLRAENAQLRELKTPATKAPKSSSPSTASMPRVLEPAPIDDTVKEISSEEEDAAEASVSYFLGPSFNLICFNYQGFPTA